MRHFVFLTLGIVFAASLVAPSAWADPPSLERYRSADKDRVELENGRGVALFRVRGGLLGYFGRGAVRITDLPRGVETEIEVDGEENVRRVNDRTVVYSGRAVSFYLLGGWWRARIQGRGIDVGAQVHGSLALVGRAGTYRLRDGDEHKWPEKRRVFQLGE
jgi:hypothetical protein